MLSDWTDATLLAHAVALLALGGMILWAAKVEHERVFWRRWPPALLVLWGLTEIADGLIYGRRWASQRTDIVLVEYEGVVSFALNVASLVLIALLIWRIWRGDMDDGR